jgi:nucleoside-diphosphate-sugar epimerase
MKSLVTGASGFIGGHLAQALVTAGDEVRVLVRKTSNTRHLANLPVEQCVGDLTHPESVRRAVAGVDRVFHCAAVVTDWGDPAVFQAVNVSGTYELLTMGLEHGIRKFVYVSSTEVYGYPDFPASEDAPFRDRGWPYCSTKIDAEKHAWEFFERGLPLTIVRPATVYGPRSMVIIEFVELLKCGQMMLIDGGRKNAGLVYVDNLNDLLLIVGEPDVGLGRAYNVTDGLDVTWGAFINALAAMLSKGPVTASFPRRWAYAAGWLLEGWARVRGRSSRPLITRMAVELTGTDQGFVNDRARQELGWTPRVSFEQGMLRVQTWLKKKGYLNGSHVAPIA